MRNSFPGYYRPSETDFKELWSKCTFSFDTNVLLNLYRSSAETQTSFLGILDSVKTRIWLPHQVGKEFHENKLEAIGQAQEAYTVIRSELENAISKLTRILDNYREHPRLDVTELLDPMKVAAAQVNEVLKKAEQKHPSYADADEVGDKISELFDGKVGKAYTHEEFKKHCEDADRRFKEKIPPGFRDQKKDGTRQYGDVFVWFQLLDYAKATKAPVVFVTADAKEDWWHQYKGRTLGPHPELIQEMIAFAGVKFYLYSPSEFVRHAKTLLKTTAPDSLDRAADELNQIKSQTRGFDWSLWNDFLTGLRIGQVHLGKSWNNFLGTQLDRERGKMPSSELMQFLQQNLHEVPLVKKAILEGHHETLVAFGPWPCECGRLVAALGRLPIGPVAVGPNGLVCKCGRVHPIPTSLYRSFYFEDEWHELSLWKPTE